MPRRKQKKTRAGDLSSPETMASRLVEYLTSMETRNYSKSTISGADWCISRFVAWCEERGIKVPTEVTRPLLERYARHLYQERTAADKPKSFRSQVSELSAVRQYFKYLARRNHVPFSPAAELELPRVPRRLPRAVLSHVEMEAVLSQPDVKTPWGVRDRAILETFYSTGMRRTELTSLRMQDVDRTRGVVMIVEGKGKKDRTVPIGERALDWIERYMMDVRPSLISDPAEQTLFLSEPGAPMSPDALSHRVTEYVNAAELEKRGSCHLFRHTMATLMLEGGADVRAIQEMLGHASLRTTQIYTHVSIVHLQEVHAATHPSAKRGRHSPLSSESEPEGRSGSAQ